MELYLQDIHRRPHIFFPKQYHQQPQQRYCQHRTGMVGVLPADEGAGGGAGAVPSGDPFGDEQAQHAGVTGDGLAKGVRELVVVEGLVGGAVV